MKQHTEQDVAPVIDGARKKAFLLAVVGVAVTAGLYFFSGPDKFYQSYIFIYMFWFGLAVGSLAALLLHQMVGGGWGFMSQRVFEAGAKTLPWMAILWIPIWAGRSYLYPWVNPSLETSELSAEITAHKSWYLTEEFWVGRTVAYFAIWIILTFFLTRWSKNLDQTGNLKNIKKLRLLSPPGIILYGLAMTFAATDWCKSLEPEWFSTMYGPIFVVGQGLSILAFACIMMSVLHKYTPLSRVFHLDFYHHTATLMCAFTVLWAYTNFGQYLIIWSGNMPEETVWYVNRGGSTLNLVAVGLIIFHFAIPLLFLLQRRVKTNITGLRNLAIWILCMRLVDLLWVIKPSFIPQELNLGLLDFSLLAALGGIWLMLFFTNLKSSSLVVQNDPRLFEAIAKLNHHDDHEDDEDEESAHA